MDGGAFLACLTGEGWTLEVTENDLRRWRKPWSRRAGKCLTRNQNQKPFIAVLWTWQATILVAWKKLPGE